MNKILNATVQDGKITLDINDLLKTIQKDKITGVEYKVEQKPMAFNTKEELDEYIKNNPEATCEGIDTETILSFARDWYGRKLFLKKANLSNADFMHGHFTGAYLMGANFNDAFLRCARFIDATLDDVSFVNANLSNTDFGRAILNGTDFSGANLSLANFTKADLSRAIFIDVDMYNAVYSKNTKFPEGFKIPEGMIKV